MQGLHVDTDRLWHGSGRFQQHLASIEMPKLRKKLSVCSQCFGPCTATQKGKKNASMFIVKYVKLIEVVRLSCCALLPSVWQHKNTEQNERRVRCDYPDADSQTTGALQSSLNVLVCERFCHCMFNGHHMPELTQISPALAWHRHHELCNPRTSNIASA